jgi:hypothetical protein
LEQLSRLDPLLGHAVVWQEGTLGSLFETSQSFSFYSSVSEWTDTFETYYQNLGHDINTTNYVESYHSVLKKIYLGLMRRQRIDFMVHLLARCYLPDCITMSFKIEHGFAKRKLDKAETKRRDAAYALNEEEAEEMVTAKSEQLVSFYSFSLQIDPIY